MSASLRTGPRALQGSEGRVAVVTLVDLPDLPDFHADVVRRVLVRLGTEPTVLGRPSSRRATRAPATTCAASAVVIECVDLASGADADA